MHLMAFCEAAADHRIASELIDRVLRERGPSWVSDVLEASPDGVRTWRPDGQGRAFHDLHKLDDYARALSIRVPHGRFDGRPGAAGSVMARTAFALARALIQRGAPIDGVVLVWDMDDQGDARRRGLEQARTEARSWATFRVVLGCPDPMREAWVLCGFDPLGQLEETRLRELRSELGFWPHRESHLLTAKDEQARRSAKRVLAVLSAGDRECEARCWQAAALDTLHERGAATGLRAYLDEVTEQLVPLLGTR